MRHRRLLVLIAIAIAAAFAGIVIASSMGSQGSGTHSMPGGQTMQDGSMPR